MPNRQSVVSSIFVLMTLAVLVSGGIVAADAVTCAVCSNPPAIAPNCGPSTNGSCLPNGCQNDQEVCGYYWQNEPVSTCFDAPGSGVDCLQDQSQQVTCSIGTPMQCDQSGTCSNTSPFCAQITLTLPSCTGNQNDKNCRGSS
jgi:hypothetical protein